MDRQEEGIDLILEFMNTVISTCDTHEHAIAYFYLAKWYELVGTVEEHENLLKEVACIPGLRLTGSRESSSTHIA